MASKFGHKDIHTRFPYLARDVLYLEQKPFATDFVPKVSDDVQMTNHRFDFMDLVVVDAQPDREKFCLHENGFCFLRSKTVLTSTTANDPMFVERAYYAEIEALLHKHFPEYSRLECLDHQVWPSAKIIILILTMRRFGEEAPCSQDILVRWSRAPNQQYYPIQISVSKVAF